MTQSTLGAAPRHVYQTPERAVVRRPVRWLAAVWKILVGSLLCLSPLTGLLVLGWLLRLMRRETLRHWFKQSHLAQRGGDFARFADADRELRAYASWPNWMLQAKPRQELASGWPGAIGIAKKAGLLLRAVLGSLGANLKAGVLTIFNVWVLTLPPCALWLFAWWGGWENSFNKGYEQFAVGPSVALAGVAAFLLVMTYLPLALARQAAMGEWKAFYGFRLVRRLVRRRWLACLGLAALYAMAGLPLFAAKGSLIFIEDLYPGFDALTPGEIAGFAKRYLFIAALYLLIALIVLRVAAARIYAGALLGALRDGSVEATEIGALERRILDRLDLLTVRPETPRHPVAKAARWASGRLLRIAGGVLTLAFWFGFVAQIFVGQFLNHFWLYWVNHPLIHLPWPLHLPTGI